MEPNPRPFSTQIDMPFEFRCPKCGSCNFEITRERRGAYALDARIMSCRCGKQLFGEKIDEEFDRQKILFASTIDPKLEAQLERQRLEKEELEADLRNRVAANRLQTARAKKEAEAEALRQREEETRQWLENVRARKKVVMQPDFLPCAWKDCSNPRRDASIYCSRSCNNKNARWRHRQRQRQKKG